MRDEHQVIERDGYGYSQRVRMVAINGNHISRGPWAAEPLTWGA